MFTSPVLENIPYFMTKKKADKAIALLNNSDKRPDYEAVEYHPCKWIIYHKRSDTFLFTQDQFLHAVQRVLFQ
jgi:hypothetical protein